jgi:hypothetical protein
LDRGDDRGQEEQGMKPLPVFAIVLGLSLAVGTHSASAQTGGTSVSYPAGLSLVSAPQGTNFSAVDGQLATYQSGTREYQQTAAAAGTTSGFGYWVTFDSPATLQLAPGATTPYTANTLTGQWVLIGDPSGSLPATVNGASVLYTYDASSGYKSATALQPGQGAWAQASGQTIVVTPQTPDALAAAAKLRANSVNGISVGVPNDWDRVTVKPANQTIDALWSSADGHATLDISGPLPLPDGARVNATRGLTDLLNDPKWLGSEQVTQSPAAKTVTGADAAAIASLTGSDPKFGPFQETVVVAMANQNVYLLDLTATTDFATQNQALLDQIVQSFQVKAG